MAVIVNHKDPTPDICLHPAGCKRPRNTVVVLAVTVSLWVFNYGFATAADDVQALWKSVDSLADARNFDSAVVVGSRCLREMEQAKDVDDTVRADRLFEVGRYNLNLNRYDQADSLWQIALELREQHLPDSHASILSSLRYLSFIYLVRGQYGQAEALLRRSLDGWEQSRPQDTSYAVNMLTRLGVICMNQSRTDAAEEFYERALSLITEVSSPDIKVANALHHNLAYLYANQKKYAEAENMWLSLVAFLENTNDTISDNLAAACVNLAELYSELDRHGEAEVYLQKSLEQNGLMHGHDSYPVAIALTSLGNSLMEQGKLRKAADTYQRSLTIKREAVGSTDRSVANTLIMYSQCERELGNTEKALSLALESFTIRRHNFVSNYWVLPEGDAIDYSTVMRGSANAFFAAFAQRSYWDTSYVRAAANIILATKGQVTDCMFDRRQSLDAADDSTLSALMDRYKLTAKTISGLYLKGPGGGDPAAFRGKMDSLSRVSQELEVELAASSLDFQTNRDLHDVHFDNIQSLLPANSVLIEYLKFEMPSLIDSVHSNRYFVLVLNSQGEPVVRDIGGAEPIDSLVLEYRRDYDAAARMWPELSDSQIDHSHAVHGALYRQVIAPVEEYLYGKDLVLLAPDGPLNLISFGGLPSPKGEYLIEQYALQYLAAGRDLVRLQVHRSPGSGLLAFGGIDFESVAASPEQIDRDGHKVTLRSTAIDSAEVNLFAGQAVRAGLDPLPYTRREVSQVAKIWERTRHESTFVVTGREASEERFKKMAPGMRAIHCATHGFFAGGRLPSSAGDSYLPSSNSDNSNPLVKSGLFFAGVAGRLNAPSDSAGDDGFLTALEVGGMDLTGVEWVVLSACGSGLGELQQGEGVYGLRRAFMMAGARTVISSLWSVPDKQTQSMMEQLYAARQANLALAMQQMVQKEIAKQRSSGLPLHPFSWGAFVAVGDWRSR